MNDHTKGKLVYEPMYYDFIRDTERVCSIEYPTATPEHEIGERLVACWNACEGVTTEELERPGALWRYAPEDPTQDPEADARALARLCGKLHLLRSMPAKLSDEERALLTRWEE